MPKVKLGPKPFIYTMPTILVGADVAEKPNYMAVAYCTMVDYPPPVLVVAVGKPRYTHKGIMENRTFSVNIPSESQMVETDYCGIISGRNNDKSNLFANFYGELGTAPMIEECPINLECKLIETVELPHHDALFGEIVEMYASEECLTESKPDMGKVAPFIWDPGTYAYWSVGRQIGQAFRIGKQLKYKNGTQAALRGHLNSGYED